MTGIDTMFSDETLDLLYECQVSVALTRTHR